MKNLFPPPAATAAAPDDDDDDGRLIKGILQSIPKNKNKNEVAKTEASLPVEKVNSNISSILSISSVFHLFFFDWMVCNGIVIGCILVGLR